MVTAMLPFKYYCVVVVESVAGAAGGTTASSFLSVEYQYPPARTATTRTAARINLFIFTFLLLVRAAGLEPALRRNGF